MTLELESFEWLRCHCSVLHPEDQYLLAETIGQRTRYGRGDNAIVVALVKAASMTAD